MLSRRCQNLGNKHLSRTTGKITHTRTHARTHAHTHTHGQYGLYGPLSFWLGFNQLYFGLKNILFVQFIHTYITSNNTKSFYMGFRSSINHLSLIIRFDYINFSHVLRKNVSFPSSDQLAKPQYLIRIFVLHRHIVQYTMI